MKNWSRYDCQLPIDFPVEKPVELIEEQHSQTHLIWIALYGLMVRGLVIGVFIWAGVSIMSWTIHAPAGGMATWIAGAAFALYKLMIGIDNEL